MIWKKSDSAAIIVNLDFPPRKAVGFVLDVTVHKCAPLTGFQCLSWRAAGEQTAKGISSPGFIFTSIYQVVSDNTSCAKVLNLNVCTMLFG